MVSTYHYLPDSSLIKTQRTRSTAGFKSGCFTHRSVHLTLALTCVLISGSVCAEVDAIALSQSLDWEQKLDRDGIQVFTAEVPSSPHRAVRSTMQIETPLAELVALVLDLDACPRWAALCKESYVMEQQSDTEFVAYTYNDLPWPVKDRDAVTRVRWSFNPETGQAYMQADITERDDATTKKALRLTTGVTSWTFTPNEQGTMVENFAHIDPGGGMPAWVTNMLLVESPFDTLDAMRKLVAEGGYKATQVSFIAATLPPTGQKSDSEDVDATQ